MQHCKVITFTYNRRHSIYPLPPKHPNRSIIFCNRNFNITIVLKQISIMFIMIPCSHTLITTTFPFATQYLMQEPIACLH